MDEKKAPGIDDVKWLLDEAEDARSVGDTVTRLERLAEAKYSIDLMILEALLKARAAASK